MLRNATRERHDLREKQNDEGGEFPAYQEKESEHRETAQVVGVAEAENGEGPWLGRGGGGQGADELGIRPYLAEAGFVEGQEGLACVEEVAEGRGCRGFGRERERWGAGGGGGVEVVGLDCGFELGDGGRGGVRIGLGLGFRLGSGGEAGGSGGEV